MPLHEFESYFISFLSLFLVISILIDRFLFNGKLAELSYYAMGFLIGILTVIGIAIYVYLRLKLVH